MPKEDYQLKERIFMQVIICMPIMSLYITYVAKRAHFRFLIRCVRFSGLHCHVLLEHGEMDFESFYFLTKVHGLLCQLRSLCQMFDAA